MKLWTTTKVVVFALLTVTVLSGSVLGQSLRAFYKDNTIASPSNPNIIFNNPSNFHLSSTGNIAFIASGTDNNTMEYRQSYLLYDIYDHLSEVQHTGQQFDVGCTPAGTRELLTAEPVNAFDNTFLNGLSRGSRPDLDHEIVMCPSTFTGLSPSEGQFRINIWRRLYLAPSGPVTTDLGYDISRCGSSGDEVCNVTSACEVATLSQGNYVLIQRVNAFPRMASYNLSTATVNSDGELSHTFTNFENNFDHTGAQSLWDVDFPGPAITNCSLAADSGEVFAITSASYAPPGGGLEIRNFLVNFFGNSAHAVAQEGDVFTNPHTSQEMSIAYFQTVCGLTDFNGHAAFLAGVRSSPPVSPDDVHIALFATGGNNAPNVSRLISEVGHTFEDQLSLGHHYTIDSIEPKVLTVGNLELEDSGFAICKCILRDADVSNGPTFSAVVRFALDGLSGVSVIVKDGDALQGLPSDYYVVVSGGFEIDGASPRSNLLFHGDVGSASGQRSAALLWTPYSNGSYDPYNHEGVRVIVMSGDSIDLVVNGVVTPQTVSSISTPNTSSLGNANGSSGRGSPINDFGDALISGSCRTTSMPGGNAFAFWALYRNCEPVRTCDYLPDGNIDAGDVDALISIIAGNTPFGRCPPDPDYNMDGNVDSGDVDSLLDAIASGTCP